MFIYSKSFLVKHISKQLNIFVGYNLTFTKSLNTSYLEMEGESYVDWTPSKILPPIFHL